MCTEIHCGRECAVTHQGCQHLAPHGGCLWEGQSDPRWTGRMIPLSSTLLYLMVVRLCINACSFLPHAVAQTSQLATHKLCEPVHKPTSR